MKILVDDSIALARRREVEAVVRAVVGARPDAEALVVSLLKLKPWDDWSVLLNTPEDGRLRESIENALRDARL